MNTESRAEQAREYHRRRARGLADAQQRCGPKWDTMTLEAYRSLEPTLTRPLTDDVMGLRRQVIEVGLRAPVSDVPPY